ncbi:hypothetical protein PAXRUDRAFT_566881 [Paxillus rubicundulus Ve08.2h10]|uniref:Uncharacterized protein n=1 Tax=Paxillus rubicundulus Ve08.2h10 TaxID=930991 RepID=A0A0D0BR83_9AGAM|nr:hypothetical protein PAXRUDRAFT_566881 [Paxillus rubicundulus Ve08.2h10]
MYRCLPILLTKSNSPLAISSPHTMFSFGRGLQGGSTQKWITGVSGKRKFQVQLHRNGKHLRRKS